MVRPVSTMSSTTRTCLPSMGLVRSEMIFTTPELSVVQSALRVPERSRNGIEDLRRREPAIEPEGVHDDAGMLRRDAADVFRRDDEVGGDGLARGAHPLLLVRIERGADASAGRSH